MAMGRLKWVVHLPQNGTIGFTHRGVAFEVPTACCPWRAGECTSEAGFWFFASTEPWCPGIRSTIKLNTMVVHKTTVVFS